MVYTMVRIEVISKSESKQNKQKQFQQIELIGPSVTIAHILELVSGRISKTNYMQGNLDGIISKSKSK